MTSQPAEDEHAPGGGEARDLEVDELEDFRTISLKSVAQLLDTSRSSARRWLRDAGIRPVAMGRGRRGAIRYRWTHVRDWLESRRHAE